VGGGRCEVRRGGDEVCEGCEQGQKGWGVTASSASEEAATESAHPSDNYFTEMCSSSEAGSYCRRIDFVYHSTLGLGEITKMKKWGVTASSASEEAATESAHPSSRYLFSTLNPTPSTRNPA